MNDGAYVRAAALGDLMTAQVVAARLEAEGIPVRLHGEAMGPYRLTVGRLAVTELWVPGPDLERASEVLLAAEIDGILPGGDDAPSGPDGARGMRAPAVVIALLMLAFLAWRITAWAH